jgi:hypothetical protein
MKLKASQSKQMLLCLRPLLGSRVLSFASIIRSVKWVDPQRVPKIRHLTSSCSWKQQHQQEHVQHYYQSLTKDTPITIQYINEIKGKGMFARRKIQKNEILLQEVPLVSSQFYLNKVRNFSFIKKE